MNGLPTAAPVTDTPTAKAVEWARLSASRSRASRKVQIPPEQSPTTMQNGEAASNNPAHRRDLLAEVSRLVSYRYDLPETFDGLLLQLRSALHVDLVTLALADEQSNTIRMRYSRATEVVRANLPVELSVNDSPVGDGVVHPANRLGE